jgi:hypothetical protein
MGMLKDGFKTLIGFAADATVEIEEIEVTPFGVEGGGAINDATMRNTAYRTQAPKLLKTITNAGCVYAYDPACLTKILALINESRETCPRPSKTKRSPPPRSGMTPTRGSNAG